MFGNPNIGGINQFHNNQNGIEEMSISPPKNPNTKLKAINQADICIQILFI